MKGQFLKELRENTFSGSEHEDANEHIEKVLEIVDLFHILKITQDQIMLRAFPVSLTGATSRWLRNQPSGSITTWEVLKTKFLNKYCSPARTAKKIKEINNFRKEPEKAFFKWHNGTSSRTRSTETSDGLAAIQAQLNNLGREIKKVNEKVYAAQFGAPYQPGGQYRAAGPGFYQRNNGNSSYPDRRPSLEESLAKFMKESAKRHEENSSIIKEIQASTDATIRNQRASIKTLEIQIKQMSKVLQERGVGSLPNSTETNPRDQVKSILTTKTNFSKIRRIGYGPYAVSGIQHRTVPFPRRLQNFGYDDWREAQDV
ncbi:retrovirus-related pol polyprotein from transposon TNT 1-94 [Tanacetum coccineum]